MKSPGRSPVHTVHTPAGRVRGEDPSRSWPRWAERPAPLPNVAEEPLVLIADSYTLWIQPFLGSTNGV